MSDPARPLAGQIVLVTGGSSGIGRAIALAAARSGADVAITYRANRGGAEAVARTIGETGRRSEILQLDLTDGDSIRGLAPALRQRFGRIDAWINNAGADILTGDTGALSTIEKLDLLLTADLRGTILASWEAVTVMREQDSGGVIVNMSWDHVLTGMEGTNPQMYAAVKGGILSFSKSLARSVAPKIRVNIVAPGWIQTAFGEGVTSDVHRAVAESTPLKRWGTPEDVAGAAIFLASPAAAFLTGQTIMVGGGLVM
jgi:3-oxoacyl-[acyl-carrier protein] reductase